MQVNRLFKIINLLIRDGGTTAEKLAREFEVSVRTIYRDVESLSSSGIPVYMSKGKGGGIFIMNDFVLNKSLLSSAEQEEILSALNALRLLSSSEADNALLKLGTLFKKTSGSYIEIDISGWSESAGRKLELIREGITSGSLLHFRYFSGWGEETDRIVEPYKLTFKERNWYLYAYCRERQAMRYFKLSRIRDLRAGQQFYGRNIESISEASITAPAPPEDIMLDIVLEADKSMAHRIFDEFDEESISDDGSVYRLEFRSIHNEWICGYIQSFMPFITIVSPQSLKDEIRKRCMLSMQKL